MERKFKSSLPFTVDKSKSNEVIAYKKVNIKDWSDEVKKEVFIMDMKKLANHLDFLKRAKLGKIKKGK